MQRPRIAVVGLGYWGPNLVRNLGSIEACDLVAVCDADASAVDRALALAPGAQGGSDFDALLADPGIDAVALATPVPTHAELAVRVLEAGKHCFVEKPLAQTVADAERAVQAAEAADRILMVGHLLEYHPAVERLAELIAAGELGDIRYIYGNRQNLGQLRADENALWSLGAHDVAVVLSLLGEEPSEVTAVGEAYVRDGVEDVVFGYLRFPSGVAAHLHLSWLDPHKERRITVVGSKRMAVFDDMKIEGKLTVYDKGFDEDSRSWGEYIARAGESWAPRIANAEPLRTELEHFIESVATGRPARSDGASGLRVVSVLERLQDALDARERGL
ncbi:MAG: Gfo/Idh/MocA family oxidoreductase [Actinomycetes bacterium]